MSNIIIDDGGSGSTSKFGFLSNDNNYGFYEPDDTWWPTVTHYLEAKKFEGTQYESIIRRAKTVCKVKRLTRERNVLIISSTSGGTAYNIERRKVYGINNGYTPKVNWDKVRKDYLRVALREKFNKHPRLQQLLMGTRLRKFQSNDRNETADALTELRELLLEKYKPKYPTLQKVNLLQTKIPRHPKYS